MRKFALILLFALSTLCCVEDNQKLWDLSKLPKDMQNEILHIKLKENLKNLICAYDNSKKSNKLKIFFKKFSCLFVNKQAETFLREYIPARKTSDLGVYVEHLLTIAAEKNWDNLFKIILENTDFSKFDGESLTSLIKDTTLFLCANKNSKMINILQNYLNIDFDIIDNYQKLDNLAFDDEDLRNAIQNENFIDVKLLLSKGVSIDTQDSDGKTPLMISTYRDNIDIAKLLLSHPDIDLKIRDNSGNSILDDIGRVGPIYNKLNLEIIKNSKTRMSYLKPRIYTIVMACLTIIILGVVDAKQELDELSPLSVGSIGLFSIIIVLLIDTGCLGVL